MQTLRDAMDAKGLKLIDLHREVNVRLLAVGHEDVDYETVRRWALPLEDKLHRIPRGMAMSALVDVFEGAITSAVFYPPLPPPRVSRETLRRGAQ